MTHRPEALAEGFVLAESPRWHDQRLWISDLHAHRLIAIDASGGAEVLAEFDDKPSGLGFLDIGTPLIASVRKRLLLQLEEDGTTSTRADLNTLPGDALNDMVVDSQNRAYISNRMKRGFTPAELFTTARESDEGIILVSEDGSSREVARDLQSPNGLVITPDGMTLIVAESRGNRLTKFDISPDGSLTNRRLFCELGAAPDGICLDAEGAIWVGLMMAGVFRRILPGGTVTDEIRLPDGKFAIACTLGGPDSQTLFLATAWTTVANMASCDSFEADLRSTARAQVEVVRVPVPGAGLP